MVTGDGQVLGRGLVIHLDVALLSSPTGQFPETEDADARPAGADLGVAVDPVDDLPSPFFYFPANRVTAVIQVQSYYVPCGAKSDAVRLRAPGASIMLVHLIEGRPRV